MPKIQSLDVFPLRIPFEDGSAGVGLMPTKWTHLDFCLVKLTTDDGLVGWGDAFAYSCLTAVSSVVRHMLAPLVIGREITLDPSGIADLNHDLQRKTHLQGRYGLTTFAISAIDIALWDLAAKAAGKSLAHYISDPNVALRTELPAYASLVRYSDPATVSAFAEKAVDQGYRTIKLHEITAEAITAARDTIGGNIALTTDVNCNWSSEDAARLMPLMKELGLYWVEEPLFPPDNDAALAALETTYGVAIATGENACTSVEFERIVPNVTFAQPSVTKVGGVSEFLAVCGHAKAAGKTIMPHAPYFGPGYWATVQLMAARSECELFERFYVEPEAHIAPDIPLPSNGTITVPNAPGLGFEPDRDVLEKFAVA